MSYQVTVGKKAMKELEKIHGSDYRVIKETIYSLADNPRPMVVKNCKDALPTVFAKVTIELSTKSLITTLVWKSLP